MGFPTKVQVIRRKCSEQWYINLPSAVAQAMEFGKGEIVEWIIADKGHMILARSNAPPNPVGVKKLRLTPRILGRDHWIVCQSLLHNDLLQSLQRAHLVHPSVSWQAYCHWNHHYGRTPIPGLERTLQDVFEKQGRTTGVFRGHP